MPTTAEQEKILQSSVDELRRKNDQLDNGYDQLRLKILAFITGELALVAYLFATGIKLPHIVYSIIFFLFGAGLIVSSFVLLLYVLKTVTWSSPVDPRALEKPNYTTFPTTISHLEYICRCYATSYGKNLPKFERRAKMFDISLTLLFIGVIMLLVIKFGQGVVLWHNMIQN